MEKKLSLEEQAMRNRENMPIVTEFVDEFSAVFGASFKVRWAKEGDYEVGKLHDKTHSRVLTAGQFIRLGELDRADKARMLAKRLPNGKE